MYKINSSCYFSLILQFPFHSSIVFLRSYCFPISISQMLQYGKEEHRQKKTTKKQNAFLEQRSERSKSLTNHRQLKAHSVRHMTRNVFHNSVIRIQPQSSSSDDHLVKKEQYDFFKVYYASCCKIDFF